MVLQMMKTKYVQYAEERPRECDCSVAEMHTAIGAALFEDPRDLDIRLLWTQARISYFRVNWWTTDVGHGSYIRRSAFIRVAREHGGYRVLPEGPLAA